MDMNNKWIGVEDKLPDTDEEVWVCGDDRTSRVDYPEKYVTIGICWQAPEDDPYVPGAISWNDVYGDDDGQRDCSISGVTHWMKMDVPEPPKQHEG